MATKRESSSPDGGVTNDQVANVPFLRYFLRSDDSSRRSLDAPYRDSEDGEDVQGLLEDNTSTIPLAGDRHSYHAPTPGFRAVHTRRSVRVCNIFKSKACSISIVAAVVFIVVLYFVAGAAWGAEDDGRLPCGEATYSIYNETCINDELLCPIVNGQRTSRCGDGCYLPWDASCGPNNTLHEPQVFHPKGPPPDDSSGGKSSCHSRYLHISDPPYENYFISDCRVTSQVVVTSPLFGSDLTIISPRLLIAWPDGNSGIAAYFKPENGVNGSLSMQMELYNELRSPLRPFVGGVQGKFSFDTRAKLGTTIMGSIRTIRDFTESPSTLVPEIQRGLKIQEMPFGAVQLSRMWLDGVTEMFLYIKPRGEEDVEEERLLPGSIRVKGEQVHFQPGTYEFHAWHNYPRLHQLTPLQVLNEETAQTTVSKHEYDVQALSFLSYTDKVVAGGWKFLTYFGRDSLLSLLLLQPILSPGKAGAIEAILGAALERINGADGRVCHEEAVGDYATYLNKQILGMRSDKPMCDYKMIDTDFLLPIALREYLNNHEAGLLRRAAFMGTPATFMQENRGKTYRDLIFITASRIMDITEGFAKEPKWDKLIRLRENEQVGQWRDSENGLGGGRIPYDVNTALVPAALEAIASLAETGLFPGRDGWADTASKRAQFWADNTLDLFQVEVAGRDAEHLVEKYAKETGFEGPVDEGNITAGVSFYGVALGDEKGSTIKVMNTDDCFRLFLLKPTHQAQLSSFMSQVADNILRPFPLGLSTSVGLVVANPAYSGVPGYTEQFTNSAYHGTVVWSWQLSMMAAGLERQLVRCSNPEEHLEWCTDQSVHSRVVEAYNHLWDLLEANRQHLGNEVWSWQYRGGDFQYMPLGSLPPPPGHDPVESNIRQLWSLTSLTLQRNEEFALHSL